MANNNDRLPPEIMIPTFSRLYNCEAYQCTQNRNTWSTVFPEFYYKRVKFTDKNIK